jgi:transposase
VVIRVVNTASGSKAVQVVYYRNRKRVVYKHVGSGRTDEEVAALREVAQEVIDGLMPQLPFPGEAGRKNVLVLDRCEYIGVYYSYFHEVVGRVAAQIGFDKVLSPLLLDLSIIRIFEPASKLRSIELLAECFGIRHRRQAYYESAPEWLDLRGRVQAAALEFAKARYSFSYDLVFYDVTTLYFESFTEDELRKNGFSKDGKPQQPQVMVGLMVTREGLPIGYEVFAGNTFEGHTLIPLIKEFVNRNKVGNFTVVADSAMLSAANIDQLRAEGINYIVGARMGSITEDLLELVAERLPKEDGRSIRVKTRIGDLVCSYSKDRHAKDRHEMEKQLEKARQVIDTPSKNKRLKFTKVNGGALELNQELVEKTAKVLGVKGYYTNLDERLASNQDVIHRYHELYKIEQAFRVAKSDLRTRPVFHFKEEPVRLHILVCFIALVISKHIEIQAGVSINHFVKECKKITDARILDTLTQKETSLRVKPTQSLERMIRKLDLSH